MSRLGDLGSGFSKTVERLYFKWLDELGLKEEALSKYKAGVRERIKTMAQ